MAGIKKEIDGEKQALTELEQVQQKYNMQNVSLRTQLMNIRNEMGQLELAGQRNSERYRELESELGRLGTAYRKIEYEQKAFSTGAIQWGGIISGIQGVAGAFTAAQGVIGMFVTDNEKLVKIQTRLQAVMAITIGMQQVSNTLHETSAFRMTTVRRVTELYSAAQTKLATSLGISTVAAKALMASLTLGLSVVITGVIALISRWSNAQRKAAEEQKQIMDTQKRAAENTGGQLAVYKKLEKGWNDLGDNLEAKKRYIIENKTEFDKLGISIESVYDAENLFIKNKDAFIKSLEQRAMAMAAMDLAKAKYTEAYKKQIELENTPKTVTKVTYGGSPLYGGQMSSTYIEENKEYIKLEEEIENLRKEAASYINQETEAMKEYYDTLAKAGLQDKDQAEAERKAEEEAKRKTEELQREAERQKRLREQINNELLDLERNNQQSRIDLMKEGTEKELAQIDLDYEEKIAEIKKMADKWAQAQGGLLTPEQTIEISSSYSLAQSQKDQRTSDVYNKEKEELTKLLQEYQSYQQQRLSIETKYNNDILRLQEELTKATSEEEKKGLEESIRVAEERKKAELSSLDFQEFQEKIDWASAFGNLDKLSTDALKKLRDKIKEYLATVGDNIGKEDLKTVVEAFDNLDAAIANRTPVEELVSSYKSYKLAVDEVTKAKEALAKADNPEATKKATQQLTDAEKKRAESLSKMTQSVNAIGEKGQQLVGAGNDLVNMLTNLGISVPESITGTLDGLGQVMDGLASIDLTKPMSVVTGVIKSMVGVTKIIGSVFGIGSDNGVARYQALKEQLEEINAIYDKIISKSREEITFGQGFAAVEAADKALEAYYKKLANYQKLAEEGGKAGASSGSHSYAHRVNKRLSGYWGDMSKTIGENISNIQDMYKLSGDQLYIIQTQFPEAWRKISPEIRDNLEAIIDCKDEARELANALKEALTGVSYDSFYNGFIDKLSDMNTSFEDMCESFEGDLRKSIIAGLVSSQYKKRINDLYDEWAKAAESDTEITEGEAENLRKKYHDILSDMFEEREKIAQTFGWEADEEQVKSQAGAISEKLTEETASAMMGIWRGQYDSVKIIENTTSSLYADWKNAINITNNYLAAISENTGQTASNTAVLSTMNDALGRIDGRLKTLETNSNKKYI